MDSVNKCLDEKFINLSYLPFSHIFGLISTILLTLYKNGTAYILLPSTFKKNPNDYLNFIKENSVNYLSMTNYGLENIISNYSSQFDYNLSSLRTIYVGGDVIKYDLLKQFYDLFKLHGFNKDVFIPIYGMTEMGGLVSFNENRDTLVEQPIDGISSCGIPDNKNIKILIKNDDLLQVPNDNISGEILISSKNLFTDYFNVKNFEDFIIYNNERYFCTGDIGIIRNNRLYVIGRKKNLLMKNSNKYSEMELELVLKDLKLKYYLLNSHFVSFENKIILYQEISEKYPDANYFKDIKEIICQLIRKYYNLDLDDVIFITPDKIPKTELGKVKK